MPLAERLRRNLPTYAFSLLCLTCFVWVFSFSWVADDAFITFRVVAQFLNGYGLRWNIDERVQVYSHPLWMLMEIPAYFISGNVFYSSLMLSVLTALPAAQFLFRARDSSYLHRTVLLLMPLSLCCVIHDFVSCGLENPLTLCLLGWFFTTLLKTPERGTRLFFIASLCLLSRFDNMVLLLPSLVWIACTQRRRPHFLRQSIAAFAPLWAWFGFCLFYYGFIFPNTKYAKLNTGIPSVAYVKQGLHYVANLWRYDWSAAVIITSALICTAVILLRRKQTPYRGITLLMGLGIACDLAYITYVGGDFMSGRFYVSSFYLSLLLLYLNLGGYSLRFLGHFAYVLALMAGLQSYYFDPDNAVIREISDGIINERMYYWYDLGLFNDTESWVRNDTYQYMAMLGYHAYDPNDGWKGNYAVEYDSVGMFGYYANPIVIVIDDNALSDPLLARLPIAGATQHWWRIGHFSRAIPEGYLNARYWEDSSQMPDGLRQYYDKLRLITSGVLTDPDRLEAIFWFNLGAYDHWRDQYLENLQKDSPPEE